MLAGDEERWKKWMYADLWMRSMDGFDLIDWCESSMRRYGAKKVPKGASTRNFAF